MKVVFHEDFFRVYAADPAAAAGRMEAVVETIAPHVTLIAAQPAAADDIATVHTAGHIERVRRAGIYPIAALAAGGAVQTACLALTAPCFALVRPPGHHASSDSAWGFCHFNNMAVALCHLKRNARIATAMVLDIDLHFGDGTVNVLGKVEGVRVVNPEAYDRRAYLQAAARALEQHPVDMIGVSAGFDNHVADWGGLLTTDDFYDIGRLVRTAADRNSGGCFGLLEGGYNHDVLGPNVLAFIQGLNGC